MAEAQRQAECPQRLHTLGKRALRAFS